MSHIFQELVNNKGLATEIGARRRLAKFEKLIADEFIETMVIVIDGRFAPVVRLRPHQHCYMHAFLNAHIGVIG